MKNKLKIIIPIVIAVIAIIIAACVVKFDGNESVDIQSMMSTAQKYLVENNYEQAIAEFEAVINLELNNAEAYLGIAEAYVGMGDIGKAIEWLEKGYSQTGDERLKNMIDELNGDINEIPESTTEITTTPPETTTEEITTTTSAKITVPDLAGLSKDEAIKLCENIGLKYSISEAESDSIEKDFVISQQIPAGAEVDERTTFVFKISTGIRMTVTETTTMTTTSAAVVTTLQTTTTAALITTSEATATTIENGEVIDSGKCGDNVNYILNTDGLLYIYGIGDMYDYNYSGWQYWDNSLKLMYFDDVESPFGANEKIKKIIIDDGVTSIGNGIFVWCSNLETCSFSSTITKIGKDAFSNSSIKEVMIPSTVELVGESAFSDCHNLKKVEIAAKKISRYAFAYCESLEDVVLEDTVEGFGRHAFNGHPNVCVNPIKKIIIRNPMCEIVFHDIDYLDVDEVIPETAVIYGYVNSTAEEYAKQYSREFVALD